MSVRYRFDPRQGKFTVQAFATGMLSALGHSPTFVVRDYAGDVQFGGGAIEKLTLELTVRADSLELQDRVSPADREEIEGRMLRDVLETDSFTEIAYHADAVSAVPVAPGRHRLQIRGPLSLHGVTLAHQMEFELLIFGDGVRLRGDDTLRLSDFRIKPVTALAGAIRLKDDLRLAFDLAAIAEES